MQRLARGGQFLVQTRQLEPFSRAGRALLLAAWFFLRRRTGHARLRLKQDEVKLVLGRRHAVRDDLDGGLDEISVRVDAQARPEDPDVSFDRLGHGGAQVRYQALAGDLEQVEARFAVGVFEERAGTPAELEHFHVLVDDHAGGAAIGEQNAVGLFLQVGQARASRVGLRSSSGHLRIV